MRARAALALTLLCTASLHAQQPASVAITQIAGHDALTNTDYLRLILPGNLLPPSEAPRYPLLIAQCTQSSTGDFAFDLYATFAEPVDLAYFPAVPALPPNKMAITPRTEKSIITMDFLGYTHVKPMRREWEVPFQTPGQYHYTAPGYHSPNLEPASFYLRYLNSLPTLRLTLGAQSAEFHTAPLLKEIREAPLCRAANLAAPSHR